MRLLQIATVTALLVWAGPATSEYVNLKQIDKWCKGPTVGVTMYLMGVVDTAATYKDEFPPLKLCLPPDATVNQMEKAFCEYVAERGGKHHKVAATHAILALQEKWPCPKE